MELKDLLEQYEIESIDEFVPKFYYQNLTNGFRINQKAVENLYKLGYTNEQLIKVKNYNEIGLVEFVAYNPEDIYIEDNEIKVHGIYDYVEE